MAQGKPKQWAQAKILEPVELGKSGIEIVVWDKWGKTRRGTLVVSVGGIRWFPYMAKKPYWANWDDLQDWMEGE